MRASRTRPTALPWSDLAAPALTTLMGVHALRSFFSMLVWNIGQDRPATELGLIALGFWGIGLLAWPAARWLGGGRPEVRFSFVFGAVYVLDHFVSHPILTPALGVASAILWLWLFPAVIVALGGRDSGSTLLPGVLLGLAGQVALQAAQHGLDLPVLHGTGPGLQALALAFVLYQTTLRLRPLPNVLASYPDWGLAVLGPYLALQLTLLSNLGRVQFLSGWDLFPAAGFVLVGLIVAATAATWHVSQVTRIIAAAVAAGLLIDPALLAGTGVWLMFGVQLGLAVAIGGILTPAAGRPVRVFRWMIAAAMVFFVLIFLFYSRYEMPSLWVLMGVLAAVPALFWRPRRQALSTTQRVATAGFLIGMLGVITTAVGDIRIGSREDVRLGGPAPSTLSVATYNVHEAFGYLGLPDPEAVAKEIEKLDADFVGLQEVGRGWDVAGGPDLVAWLRWRLPEYRVIYAPMLGDLVGHVILSRYPITESGWQHFSRRASGLPYGLTWAVVSTRVGDLLFVTTHFSPYEPYAADRVKQAADLLAFVGRRPHMVVVGDFNARPSESAIRSLRAAGLVEMTEPHGLGGAFTFASGRLFERIDYIFGSPDVASLDASIPKTLASDHLPVFARVKLR